MKKWFRDQFFPYFYLLSLRKTLLDIIEKDDNKSDIDFYESDISIQTLLDLNQKELERKKIIDDKAKNNLIGITASIMLITPTIFLINSGYFLSLFNWTYGILFVVSLGLGFIYLTIGGLCALSSLRVGKMYDIYLTDEMQMRGNLCENLRIAKLIKFIKQNQRVSIIRTNFLDSSHIGIRNGIIFICLSVLILSTASLFQPVSPQSVINKIYGNP